MARLLYSPASKEDLVEIALYIAEDNPGRAASYIRENQKSVLKNCPNS
jgi:plasmid stabilization system protein ParE